MSTSLPIEIVLPIEGMTCASCVNRIERFLNKTDGVVEANVNLATERATVHRRPGARRPLRAGRGGRGRRLRRPPGDRPTAIAARGGSRRAGPGRSSAGTLLVQAVGSIAVAAVLMVVMFWPQATVPMTTLNWLALVPATVIQAWAGRRFYVAAFRAARHGATNMDTLVAAGTSAAWAYSVVVTVAPGLVESAGREPITYFDSSTIIIGLVLLGRWLEARAKDQTGGAIRRLIGLQPRDRAPRRRTGARWTCRWRVVRVGDLLRVRAGREGPGRRDRRRGRRPRSTSRC